MGFDFNWPWLGPAPSRSAQPWPIEIRRTALQCPGVSDQYVLYTAVNAVLTCFKGRPSHATDPKFWRSLGDDVGAIFRSWALLRCMWRFLQRFLARLVGFHASWGAPGSILEGLRWLQAWFWSPDNLFFNVFTRYCASGAQMLRPLENIGRSGTKRTWELVRDTTPASKIDDEHNPRANIAAAGTPGFVLDGHGHAPGVSWALLGRSWARLGRSWAPLGRFLAASWALLGVF